MSDYLQFLANVGIGGAHPGGLPLTKAVLANETIEKPAHVLDLGCGTGQTSAFLAKQYGCQVTALDVEKKMLEKAQQRFDREQVAIPLVESSAEQLPFKAPMFDFIIAESVIAFTEAEKALQQCFRALKNGGRLIAIEMTKAAEHSLSAEEEKQIQSFYGVKKIMTEQEWRSKMQDAGFETIFVMDFGETYSKKGLEEMSELTLTRQFDFRDLCIWVEHQEWMAKLRNRLTYRVYKAIKSVKT